MPYLSAQIDNLVFIDETHFVSSDLWKKHGWFLLGCLPLNIDQNLWNKESLSLLMAIGVDGIVHYSIKDHESGVGVKALDFVEFLLDLDLKLPQNKIIIMDNAKIHKSAIVRAAVTGMMDAGRSVLYQSPYSPELNPIELSFGWLKKKVKNVVQAPQDLHETVENVLKTVKSKECGDTIRHVFKNIPPNATIPAQFLV